MTAAQRLLTVVTLGEFNLPTLEEHTMSVNKGMSEEPKGRSIRTLLTDGGIA